MPSGIYKRGEAELARLRAMAKASHRKAVEMALEVNLNWAGDPCGRCGKYPLSIYNKHGYCRKCARKMRMSPSARKSISYYQKRSSTSV